MRRCPMRRCPMRRCPMRRCPMRRCPMRRCPMRRCPMRRCPMRRCPMRRCPMRRCPMRRYPEPRGPSRQSANVLACAASASTVPPGPRASAAAHAGSAGSTRHDDPGPASVAPWPPFRITPAVFPGPKDVARSGAVPMRSGADRVQVRPLPSGQAAIRLVSAPDPARSNATTPPPAAVSRTTLISSPASDPGTAGPAACQLPSRSAKRPAIPLRLQLAASIGTPDPPNAAAIRPPTPQALPAGVAASTAALARRVHVFPPPAPSSAVPPLVSAMRRPPAPLARASGASARPGVSGPAGDQLVPPSPEVASGEKVRSWLGWNPVTSDPPGAGDVEAAVVGHPGRGRQPPPRRSRRPHEKLPEVILLGRRAAHVHDRPAGSRGAGEGRSQRGCGRNRRRARVRRRFGAAARGQHAGRRDHGAGRGSGGAGSSPAGHVHDCFDTRWAALVSSAANDDSVLAVPGPGSKLSSVRVFPPASITKATSLWPIIPPAGRTCVPMA